MEELLIELSEIRVGAKIKTNPEIRGGWSYTIVANNMADCLQFEETAEGSITLCDCSGCRQYEREILEIFALCKAIAWVKSNEPKTPIKIYVSSALLGYAASNPDYFHHKIENSGSCLLRALRNEFWELTTTLDVEILRSGYNNEEIIPACFEVSGVYQSNN